MQFARNLLALASSVALATSLASAQPAFQNRTLVPQGGTPASGEQADRRFAVSNGFGQLLPHRVRALDREGQPTSRIVDIAAWRDAVRHVRPGNPILPPVTWPAAPTLPNGAQGNHFLLVELPFAIDVDSVLDPAVSATPVDQLLGTILVVAIDPVTGAVEPVRGRAFLDGRTYGAVDPSDPTRRLLERWVELDANGKPIARTVSGSQPGLGFPGTEQSFSFAGAERLVARRAFVFVADTDNNLATPETFPANREIQLRLLPKVQGLNGARFQQPARVSATVGADTLPIEIVDVLPQNADANVDPSTTLTVEFTEAAQLTTVGDLDGQGIPALSLALEIAFGPSLGRTVVPFTVRADSVYDLTTLTLRPGFSLPGSEQIDVFLRAGQVADLNGSTNQLARSSFFVTADGAGIVNAPVAPDTIYIGRLGSDPSVSVLDLNGFGASTGNPTYDPLHPIIMGNSNYPNNPNLFLQGVLLLPPLFVGSTTLDGGSAGVMTRTLDSNLDDRLIRSPAISSVGDMALGQPLDILFNNAAPFGCQAGGGNICAATGLKLVSVREGGPNTLAPTGTGTPLFEAQGVGNLVSWAPHPNPPPLLNPPLCISPAIGGLEPTAFDTTRFPPSGPGLVNLLIPSNMPFGNPAIEQPPQGLLAAEQNAFFEGPSLPQSSIVNCSPYMQRQQVGQFLYLLDRAAREVVVLNSNRFTVIDRVSLPDPTSLAMSPNLDLLAVTNAAADTVSFIDVDPLSATLHRVVAVTRVGRAPRGIAWESGNEDIFVCNEGDDSVSILSAFDLRVRKTLRSNGAGTIQAPIDVALTPRQTSFGSLRGVYFGYILNGDGTVALFESGPNGLYGIGYDDVVGNLPYTFSGPVAIQPDVERLESGVWILHDEKLDTAGNPTGIVGGAVTNVALAPTLIGVLPLDPQEFTPRLRGLDFQIARSIGQDQLTGQPVDLAFDNQANRTALPNFSTEFSAGEPIPVNGKSLVRDIQGTIVTVSAPQFLFLAVPNSDEGPGVLDVIDLATDTRLDTNVFTPGVQSIPVPGAGILMDYLRQ